MDSKQDYFRSPAPKNFEHFYSPFRLVRHEQDPNLINSLLSPFNRNANSYISYLSPAQFNIEEGEHANKQQKPGAFCKILSFGNQDQEQQQQLSQQLETPKKNPDKIVNMQTTSRKKYDLRVIEPSEKIHFSRDGQRGLRALSKQAYQIFQHSDLMTYQEVAERIIEENEELNEFPEKKKERQSIKRRVYDALNVLIAVGILQKQGKKISLSRRMKQENEKQIDTRKHLVEKFDDRIKLIEAKKKRLQKIREQKESLSRLTRRNSLEAKRGDDKINFPFVVANQLIEIKNKTEAKINGFVCGQIDAISILNKRP